MPKNGTALHDRSDAVPPVPSRPGEPLPRRSWRPLLVLAVAFGGAVLAAPAQAPAQAHAPVRVPAQDPAPGGESAGAGTLLLRHGAELLELEDPVAAWQSFRRAAAAGGDAVGCRVGLGRAHLMLGQSAVALGYADGALHLAPDDLGGMALGVRALIRARQFDDAVARAAAFLARTAEPDAELLAARASALFRVQRVDDAAAAYRRVLDRAPLHAEAHLRLGSGLVAPAPVAIPPELSRAAAALAANDRTAAIAALRTVLANDPEHPIAHRLLGETLFAQQAAASMAARDASFAQLAAALPAPDVRGLPIAAFVPGYAQLSPPRRRVVDRTMAMFGRHLGRLVAVGGRHDLLRELERTTDAEERANLRGRRTFDGRVWDDVRGVGGIQAATGIEALDDAAAFGFDTLAHEVAHQVHYFALTPLQRARIRALYHAAVANGRCLDYYAATNEAEYFGQGVEAFATLAKRPGGETTHGHTRFELLRVDPELHDLVASVVDHDPLARPAQREVLLDAAIAVALRVGRPHDALVAARLLAPGERRERRIREAERAVALARCH
jgi:hypothetical protein